MALSFTQEEQATIDAARDVLARATVHGAEVKRGGATLESILTGLCLEYGPLERENCGAIFVDGRNRLLDVCHVAEGDIGSVPIYYRELMGLALQCGAIGAILWHSHPSGEAIPSDADIRATKHAAQTLAPFNVRLLDHYVVSTSGHASINDYVAQRKGRKS